MSDKELDILMAQVRGLTSQYGDFYILDGKKYCRTWEWKPTIDMKQAMECAVKADVDICIEIIGPHIAIGYNTIELSMDHYQKQKEGTPTWIETATDITLEEAPLAICKTLAKALGKLEVLNERL